MFQNKAFMRGSRCPGGGGQLLCEVGGRPWLVEKILGLDVVVAERWVMDEG